MKKLAAVGIGVIILAAIYFGLTGNSNIFKGSFRRDAFQLPGSKSIKPSPQELPNVPKKDEAEIRRQQEAERRAAEERRQAEERSRQEEEQRRQAEEQRRQAADAEQAQAEQDEEGEEEEEEPEDAVPVQHSSIRVSAVSEPARITISDVAQLNNLSAITINLAANAVEDVQLREIRFQLTGAIPRNIIGPATLYNRSDRNVVLAGPINFGQDASEFVFRNLSLNIAANSSIDLELQFSLTELVLFTTVQIGINGRDSIIVTSEDIEGSFPIDGNFFEFYPNR